MNTRIPALVLILSTGLVAVPQTALAGGGTIVKLDGSAVIERRATKVPVAAATPLYSGDTLTVAEAGSAQVRFEDDSVLVVPGPARLRVDAFTMPSGSSGGKALYTLVEGGVRALTGGVSKNAKDQYELRTEEATITVAGSSYTALRCDGACAKKYKPGLYVRGESGTVFMTNAAGRLKLQRGQTGYVANNTTLATHVKVSPLSDPMIASEFGIAGEFDTEVHPPRIEQEPPASPS
jgi:hypothetical protein